MVVSVKALIRFFDPQQFLFLRTQGVEDCLTVTLAVDEEVPPKLRHDCGDLDHLCVWQRRFLIEAEARTLTKPLVQPLGCFVRIDV